LTLREFSQHGVERSLLRLLDVRGLFHLDSACLQKVAPSGRCRAELLPDEFGGRRTVNLRNARS
jgi:hypothetical protein